jgi:hypothetical protein
MEPSLNWGLYLGNNEKKNLYMFNIDTKFFKEYFWIHTYILDKSMVAELLGTED